MTIKERDGAVEIAVRGALKVRLTTPPVDDRANHRLCRLLAERLKVPVSAVRIVAAEKSRTKRVSITGVSRLEVAALFEAKPAGSVELAS